MSKKALILLALLCLSLPQWGCVSMGKYELKEKEAGDLTKNLQELQQKYTDLSKENADLKAQVQKLTGDLEGVTGERDRLVESKKMLADSLKSTADAKNQKIAELSQQISDLEKENAKLKEDIANTRKAKEEEVQKTSKTYEEMLDKMKNEISKGQVTISELKGKLTVNMLNAILFDSGKAEVKPEGLEVLQKVIDILKTVKDKAIRIEGHTDNVQIIGELTRRYPTNWELSAARAINVTRYLQQQGIDPALLAAVAYGEYKPVASNDTEEGKAKNRRIEIILVPKD
ncbi:MAG TPA: OmpA family protein [Geobacteraceae bacterium]|nr:OmpA family protein [Geobacteraceae bacterium]